MKNGRLTSEEIEDLIELSPIDDAEEGDSEVGPEEVAGLVSDE